MTKKKLFVWTCDYSENSGEGKLARLFISYLNHKKKYILKFNQRKILKFKYLSTLLGIIYCWNKYFKNQKVCYLNYLPFWNFIIFIFLPPKTILGPITGGANFSKSNLFSLILRGFVFPFFYKISEFFLNLRDVKIIFSTELLKKYLFKRTIKNSNFNFIIQNFSLKKNRKIKKEFDFIIYNRKHKNKRDFFPFEFINKLSRHNFKICIVGEKLNISSVKNYGFLNNKKIQNLQSKSKYTIASGENLFSFFVLECLTNHVKIIVKKNMNKKIVLFKKKFIELDFNSLNSIKKIKKIKQ